MITEDYCSFEIAKLLKEKGFDETCYACYEYFSSNITMYSGWPFEYKGKVVHNSNNVIKCPTLQTAMKWLREVHNIAIETEWEHLWYAYVKPMTANPSEDDYYQYSSAKYEEAIEVAIKYCLENLI